MLDKNSLTSYMNILVALALLSVVVVSGPKRVAAAVNDEHISTTRRSMRVVDYHGPVLHTSGDTWQAMLSFVQPAKYEYLLRREGSSSAQGSLTIQVAKSYVMFKYDIDSRSGGALWRSEVVTPGETLITALLTSGEWSIDDIRMIWTPFMITRWVDELSQLKWRVGPGWATRSGSSTQFTIDHMLQDNQGNIIFRGRLDKSGGRVLDIDVNLKLPLPEYIKWRDDAGNFYEAELISK